MPLPEIPQLEESDTFQDLFTSTNTSIDRLNLLEIANIFAGSGITYTGPNNVGGITLSVDLDSSIFLNNDNEIGFKVFNSVPTGLTIGSPIGITGATFGSVSNLSLDSSRKYLGIITELYSDGYRITTSGRKITGTYFTDNTLYYLANGGVTSTIPTSNGQVIKPILFSIGLTYGFVVLNQKETLISESTSYIKSASRTIAEISTNSGFSAGNVIFYDITGSTWAKSSAAANNTSEVFGVIENITGLTATIVTHGSVNIPNTMLHDIGSSGGSGGNDIWFLSGITSGHMQNLAPTAVGNIIKPVYYAYPHEFNGTTFSGLVVNYIGYSVSSATSSTTTSTTNVGSIFASPILVLGNTVGPDGKSSNTSLIDFYINKQIIYSPTFLDFPDNVGILTMALLSLATNSADFPEILLAQTISIPDQKYNMLVTNLGLKGIGSGLDERNLGYLHYIATDVPFSAGQKIMLDGIIIGGVVAVDTNRILVYIKANIGNVLGVDVQIGSIGITITVKRLTAVGFVLPNYGSTPLWHMKLQ